MQAAVLRETYPGERRVALVPSNVRALAKAGLEIIVEQGAGVAAGFSDQAYVEQGARVVASREEALAADVLLYVRALGANLQSGRADLPRYRSGQIVVGMCDPLGSPQAAADIAKTGATLIALELIPRTTRAQAMDVLSSMATISGYKAVLVAATESPQMFPMITYAAGMLRPARVFVLGAGVAGLRAMATARQLGAMVQGHDIRPTSSDEIRSVGAKFVELKLEGETQDKGGYARQLTEADYQRQRELIGKVAAESDIVIATAAIPGRKSPLLLTASAVAAMPAGAVVVDLAAERGGNCELTKADQRVVSGGVTILGPTNLPSEVPLHASLMFSNNVTRLLLHLFQKGRPEFRFDDDILRETTAAWQGEVVQPRMRHALDLPAIPWPPVFNPPPPAEGSPPPLPAAGAKAGNAATSKSADLGPIPFDNEGAK